MPHLVPPILPPNRGGAGFRTAAASSEPAFSVPVRWTLRVLAWLAFGVASYLAWHALMNTAVAGCVMGSNAGCDVVLTSRWSTWFGVPVAFLGLGCYATLAALSVVLGLKNAAANRWITTAFVMLSISAAGASLWFVGIQVFAIGSFCWYCITTDVSGILLGVIATVFAVRAITARRGMPQPRALQPGLMALRAGLPGANPAAPQAARSETTPPSLILAVSAAVPLVLVVILGQVLSAPKKPDIQSPKLDKNIELVATKTEQSGDAPPSGRTYVTRRVPTDGDSTERTTATKDSSKDSTTSGRDAAVNGTRKPADATPAVGPVAPPTQSRIINLLKGSLKLNVYDHPIIGSPEAKHIVVELISYDCPHCRHMYPMMEHALERYGDQVALVVLTVPMEKDCNRLVTDPAASHQGACTTSRLAVGISKVNPPSFVKFHEFLMSGSKDKPPAMEVTYPEAYVLADRDQLRELSQSQAVASQIDGYIDLFERLQKQNSSNKNFGLPIQILGDHIISGSVQSEADMFKAWEDNLGVKPQ